VLAKFVAAAIEGFAKLINLKSDPGITKFRILAVTADHHYSIEKAVKELNYKPKVSTQEGIKRTVDWYKKHTLHN